MARVSRLLTPELLSEAKKEYSKLKEGRVVKKLAAIMSYFDYTSKEVSKIFSPSLSKNRIFLWISCGLAVYKFYNMLKL